MNAVIEAIKESWNLTTGHSVTIFLIGLLSIPIIIAGLLVCCVGVIVSSMWIELAFAYIFLAIMASKMIGNDVGTVQIEAR